MISVRVECLLLCPRILSSFVSLTSLNHKGLKKLELMLMLMRMVMLMLMLTLRLKFMLIPGLLGESKGRNSTGLCKGGWGDGCMVGANFIQS